MWTGIPVVRLSTEETERLLHMEDALHKRYIGQRRGSRRSAAPRRARRDQGPEAADRLFIFRGPRASGRPSSPGHSPSSCSERGRAHQDRHERVHGAPQRVALVGALPGYVGFDEGGQLTEAVRRKSYSVVLLDEIEKAHPEVFNILLQILEDGHLTDAKGRRVDFRNTVIIMTSNVGAQQLRRTRASASAPAARTPRRWPTTSA